MPQSATSQAKQNSSLQPQQHHQSQQQPIAPQQQLDLTISSETAPSAQNNVVPASNSNLQAEPLSFQQDFYASSQANSQSFSSAISDDLLSELENSADDLEFLSSTSWPDQTTQQFGSRFNQQNSWPEQSSHQTRSRFNQQNLWPDQPSHQVESRYSQQIPPPLPFSTLPKLEPVEKVMNDHPGNDVATLRELAIALARDAVFGREELIKNSLSGRKNTGSLDRKKLDYIKTVVHTRRPTMSDIDFEQVWTLCRQSISKSCQTLQSNAKRKL